MPAAIVRSAATLGLERAMLVPLALVLSLAACQEPEQTTGPSLSQAALPNSITLTYICGNSFRVRNTNPEAITVTWDVYQKGETGTLVLPPKPASAPYSETYFTTVNKGTVRLFLDGVLKQTKANGNKPACELPVDTTKPPIPAYGWPADSAFVSEPTPDSIVYYRRILSVTFQPTATGPAVAQFLSKYSATIVGGRPDAAAYVIQIPDPGPSLESLAALTRQMRAEPEVEFVILITYRSGPPSVDARFPTDGQGFDRRSWGDEAGPSLWGLKAIRAPLAWGCENGAYGAAPVVVAVVEWGFESVQGSSDFAGSMPAVFTANATLGEAMSPSTMADLKWHGTAVAGTLAAIGDNGRGVAGMMWHSDLRRYALGREGAVSTTEYFAFRDEILGQRSVDQPRIVTFSIELRKDSLNNPDAPKDLAKRLVKLLTDNPSMLIVKSSGNYDTVITAAGLASLSHGSHLILDALVRVRLAGFRDRVVIVGGSQRPTSGGYAQHAPTRFVDGETDILAPADGIEVLGGARYGQDVVVKDGTSFAAPMVAGVAAQLLAMQPNLTPAQVKQYIIEGAQEPRLNPETGVMMGPEQLRLRRSGATQSVFHLDAYGSLTKLSREDPRPPSAASRSSPPSSRIPRPARSRRWCASRGRTTIKPCIRATSRM